MCKITFLLISIFMLGCGERSEKEVKQDFSRNRLKLQNDHPEAKTTQPEEQLDRILGSYRLVDDPSVTMQIGTDLIVRTNLKVPFVLTDGTSPNILLTQRLVQYDNNKFTTSGFYDQSSRHNVEFRVGHSEIDNQVVVTLMLKVSDDIVISSSSYESTYDELFSRRKYKKQPPPPPPSTCANSDCSDNTSTTDNTNTNNNNNDNTNTNNNTTNIVISCNGCDRNRGSQYLGDTNPNVKVFLYTFEKI